MESGRKLRTGPRHIRLEVCWTANFLNFLDRLAPRDHNGHVKPGSNKSNPPAESRRTANVAQLKARLSEYLRQVKTGEEVVITERGVPVARLAPLDADQRRATRRERLIRAGLLRPAKNRGLKLGMPKSRPGAGTAVLEALRAERDEGY